MALGNHRSGRPLLVKEIEAHVVDVFRLRGLDWGLHLTLWRRKQLKPAGTSPIATFARIIVAQRV
jgi:hypothetical protein